MTRSGTPAPQRARRRLGPGGRALIRAIFITGTLWALSYQSLRAHGDEHHDDTTQATHQAIDTSASLEAFTQALDSVYEGLAGTFRGIEPILKASCYDCHSDQTRYPWYHGLPWVGSYLDGHIAEAREHLDMSDGFPFGGHASQLEQLNEIRDEIEDGDMPLQSYRLLHWGTLIEGERQDTLFQWIDSSRAAVERVYEAFGQHLPGEDEH